MTYEGSTSFVAAEDAVRSSKTLVRVIGRYGAHRRTLQSEYHKCLKLDILSCIHFLSYRCNIVQEVALTSTDIKIKNIVNYILLRCYAT
jgi:hypothetical protein